jgi:hypothetical protein
MSQRTYYRAVMPQAAWKNGREPRERRRRRRAVDDLIDGLGRYLATQRDGVFLTPDPLLFHTPDREPIRSDYTDRMKLAQWVSWAARLADPCVRCRLGPAPDGSEWSISSRCELL